MAKLIKPSLQPLWYQTTTSPLWRSFLKKLDMARELWQPAGETTEAIPAGAIYGRNRLKDGECSRLVETNSAQFFST